MAYNDARMSSIVFDHANAFISDLYVSGADKKGRRVHLVFPNTSTPPSVRLAWNSQPGLLIGEHKELEDITVTTENGDSIVTGYIPRDVCLMRGVVPVTFEFFSATDGNLTESRPFNLIIAAPCYDEHSDEGRAYFYTLSNAAKQAHDAAEHADNLINQADETLEEASQRVANALNEATTATQNATQATSKATEAAEQANQATNKITALADKVESLDQRATGIGERVNQAEKTIDQATQQANETVANTRNALDSLRDGVELARKTVAAVEELKTVTEDAKHAAQAARDSSGEAEQNARDAYNNAEEAANATNKANEATERANTAAQKADEAREQVTKTVETMTGRIDEVARNTQQANTTATDAVNKATTATEKAVNNEKNIQTVNNALNTMQGLVQQTVSTVDSLAELKDLLEVKKYWADQHQDSTPYYGDGAPYSGPSFLYLTYNKAGQAYTKWNGPDFRFKQNLQSYTQDLTPPISEKCLNTIGAKYCEYLLMDRHGELPPLKFQWDNTDGYTTTYTPRTDYALQAYSGKYLTTVVTCLMF